MAKDFFGTLGETLTKTARELSGRAEEVYETQRLRNKISGEERQINKAMADLGKIIYKRYRDGVPVDEEEKAICEQIDDRMAQVDKYKEEMDGVKGNRFCPSCGNPIGRNDAFCSRCGAACPIPEPEEEAGDTVDGTAAAPISMKASIGIPNALPYAGRRTNAFIRQAAAVVR